MKLLFLSLVEFGSAAEHGIYQDLMRALRDRGCDVCILCPTQRRNRRPTELVSEDGIRILRVRTGNITGCGMLEKGIATLKIEGQFKRAIKKYFKNDRFDLVLYSTPPVTFAKVVDFVKRRDGAKSYLLLKDIFPQNAVDIGILKKSGLKGLLWRYFRRKEKRLYALSDRIGCMSAANVRFLCEQDPEIDPALVEICPNSLEVRDMTVDADARRALREKYGIPQDKIVLVYGGNLGRPQGIDFLMECLRQRYDERVFFLIVGDGTEYGRLEAFFAAEQLPNAKLLRRLPKEDYDRMVAACDVGLIFLDHRFTIPNFPSRLLAYTQAALPVLAATDANTDVGQVIDEGGFGLWCESKDPAVFASRVRALLASDLAAMGRAGQAYAAKHYNVTDCADTVLRSIEEKPQ